MSYEELLKDSKWHEKCYSILKRDGYRCRKCKCNGYHADLIAEFEKITDIDILLSGMTIDGMSVSDYIIKDMNNNNKTTMPSILRREEVEQWHGYNLYYCGGIFSNAVYIRTKSHIKEYENLVLAEDNHITKFSTKSNLKSILPDGLNTNLTQVYSALFNQTVSDSVVIAIERIPITSGFVTSLGDLITSGGNIVISITYKNYAVSFYLMDKRWHEISEDGRIDFEKELQQPFVAKGLNVHHRYYIKGNKPWEYSDDALITLCESCHKLTHARERTRVYRRMTPSPEIYKYYDLCSKCGGSGYLPQYHYYYEGVCFACWGEGVKID